ncbi:MAG: FkbM family methyltransferase [Candidatus Buchananbacteria bacterium]
MAQTVEIFPRMKKIYKKLFKSQRFAGLNKAILVALIDFYAKMQRFNFPVKYAWDWKLEMLLKRYEADTVKVFKNIIKPGMTVIDIGAHIGYYTKLFAKLVGRKGHVYAFEASEDNFNILKKNVSRFPQVKLFNQAVTDHVGTVDFYLVSNRTGCHSVVFSSASTKISVPAITIDQFVIDQNIKSIDAIKIDIEGGESLAFAGMRDLFMSKNKFSIITEFNPDAIKDSNISPKDFLDNVQVNGFEIYIISDSGETQRTDIDGILNHRVGYTSYNLLLVKN